MSVTSPFVPTPSGNRGDLELTPKTDDPTTHGQDGQPAISRHWHVPSPLIHWVGCPFAPPSNAGNRWRMIQASVLSPTVSMTIWRMVIVMADDPVTDYDVPMWRELLRVLKPGEPTL